MLDMTKVDVSNVDIYFFIGISKRCRKVNYKYLATCNHKQETEYMNLITYILRRK